jgi:hypothetical protein
MKKIYFVIVISVAAVFCSGCGNKKASPARAKVTPAQGNVKYPMPTAYEITNRINSAGAAFVIGVTNPVSNHEAYLTTARKALNVGVYGADLAYASTYNQEQETRNYLHTLHALTGALDINTNFNAELVKNIEDNIDNKDTVISIISSSFDDTYNFLVNNGQDDVSLFVLIGTWIEGVYLATYLATTSEKPELLDVITNQAHSLNTLLDLLEGTQDVDLQAYTTKLAVLDEALTVPEGKTFTLADAVAFREKIEALRNEVVKVQ